MGQKLSCGTSDEHELFSAVQCGDLETVKGLFERNPSLVHHSTVYDRQSALHIAAANGQIEVVSMLVDQSVNVDLFNRYKQTPLMLAAMHGKISCVEKLIEAGANILMFDTLNGRTCLHYAAYYGHSDCLKTILCAAQTSHIASSWGYARFVNVKDGKGATPLHLAARQRRPECVHILLDNGALACASTGRYGFPGSTSLHLAARAGSLDCIRELLAWGADRLQRDDSGRIPYTIAFRHKHGACAALLNPSSAEPLVWPSPLKFISELNEEAKHLLECALIEANKEREKNILKGTTYSPPSPTNSDNEMDDNVSEVSDTEVCCICFDQVCTIQVQDCGHQMCAHCVLALCCHKKPSPTTTSPTAPVCPFCRSIIVQLDVIKLEKKDGTSHDVSSSKLRKSRRSRNFSEGSNSFKSLSAVSSFGKMVARGSGRIAAEDVYIDKPIILD
ncbi:putative E3 ubiquitin-protein ligase XBAT31 [Capsicum annuum]|uniref:RING-type E3 ubiquitin transferase n=1 Tax=Capsicum annuum TaxID=4072 RepID=A0A2G2ZDW5_CAPAN|nr:putative E3 ubiquitin-protein ligase XBAT31 [Capsicum annuum]KAF3650510.1 putative E3 ubiquitin-protein ligase XBAT31 [Capsicum annuum]KAF3661968.1 putative E3 ubiquitin-protein ligase XBAT31 [Capsicum annuum]PHT80203.1 putative E3 ubiquitin-protein ligase XBAT31 [Capsicum annuum]